MIDTTPLGVRIKGVSVGDKAGISVSGGGDINGDGIDDFIIGASNGDPDGERTGEAYVIFGSTDGFDAAIDLSPYDRERASPSSAVI